MADPDPTLYRQRALAINSVSGILNNAGHWAEPETCDAIVTAVLDAHTPAHRVLTIQEHDRAWHAIEGSSGAEDADPCTVLAAVLRALNITAPTAEDEAAHSLQRRQATTRQTSSQQPDICRPLNIDGTALLVRGQGEMTEQDQVHAAAVIQAAQRAHDAAPKCPNCGHLWKHHGEEVCGVRSRHEGTAYECGCTDAEEDHPTGDAS